MRVKRVTVREFNRIFDSIEYPAQPRSSPQLWKLGYSSVVDPKDGQVAIVCTLPENPTDPANKGPSIPKAVRKATMPYR